MQKSAIGKDGRKGPSGKGDKNSSGREEWEGGNCSSGWWWWWVVVEGGTGKKEKKRKTTKKDQTANKQQGIDYWKGKDGEERTHHQFLDK